VRGIDAKTEEILRSITMTPEDRKKLIYYVRSAAKLLKANTPKEQLQDFESIELVARQHLLETVGPAIREVFFAQENQKTEAKNVK
jgi:hypothetical protein